MSIMMSNYATLLSLTLVSVLLHVADIACQPQSKCTQKHISPKAAAPDPNDCVNDFKLPSAGRAAPGDAFSFGSLDDFCLITGISTENLYDEVKQNPGSQPAGQAGGQGQGGSGLKYVGTGATLFPVLQQLVEGRAWSYNAQQRLDVANIDWNLIRDGYQKTYDEIVWLPLNESEAIQASIREREDRAAMVQKVTFADSGEKTPAADAAAAAKVLLPPALPGLPGLPNPLAMEVDRQYQAVIKAGTVDIAPDKSKIDALQKSAWNGEWRLGGFTRMLDKLTRLKDETPDFEAPNPYFIEATAITVDEEILKNFLHIRVFLNRSVADRFTRLHSGSERKDNARGRIVSLMIMVKDQDGWPVGDFSTPVPCSKTCDQYGKLVYSHNERNDIPCGYTPPTASTHPGVFFFPRDGEETKEGFAEIHATWSFTQDSCNFVTSLHIQTLVLEDFKTRPGPDSYNPGRHKRVDFGVLNATGETSPPRPAPPPSGAGTAGATTAPPTPLPQTKYGPKEHIYGWTARYDVIHPTVKSLGAPDFVNIKRLKNRDTRGSFIDCHVPLKEKHGFIRGISPQPREIPSKAAYSLAVQSSHDPAVNYYGQHTKGSTKCSSPGPLQRAPESKIAEEFQQLLSLQKYLDTPGVFCPCPAGPTTPNPEDQTPSPERLHGRLLHGSHMAMAWLVLVPLSWFVARYYKETYSSLFCLQEYWWFMWHICVIFTAAVFGIGGFVSIESRARHETLETNWARLTHLILGFFSFALFFIQIISGFFRCQDPKSRKWQICAHFVMGCLNMLSAVAGILVVAFVRASGLSCNGVYTIAAWIIFWCIMFALMEWHIHAMDNTMKLAPPRAYLPPPVKRLFGRDAPGRAFRAAMLLLFIIGQLLFYWILNSFIWASGGESCRDQMGDIGSNQGSTTPDYNYYYG